MAKHLPITRQQLLDPEGSAIQLLLEQARKVLYRAMHGKGRERIYAAGLVLSHYQAKPTVQAVIHGPVILTWSEPSSSPTPLALSSESSTTPGSDNGRGQPSPSVTDDLESL